MQKLSQSKQRFAVATEGRQIPTNIWRQHLETLDAQGTPFDPNLRKELLDWDAASPEAHANCPLLDRAIRELARMGEAEWRAQIDAIYVGWDSNHGTLQVEDLAQAASDGSPGYIRINLSFAYASTLVTALSHDIYKTVDSLIREREAILPPTLDRADLAQIFSKLRADPKNVTEAILRFNQRRRMGIELQVLQGVQGVAEKWMIAHELGHLLMGDLRRGARNQKQKSIFNKMETLLREVGSQMPDLQDLSSGQRDELRADVFALMLVSSDFHREHATMGAYGTGALGALSAIGAIGLLDGAWNASISHPSPLVRAEVIARCARLKINERGSRNPLVRDREGDQENAIRMLAAPLATIDFLAGSSLNSLPAEFTAAQISAQYVLVATSLFTANAPLFSRGAIFRSQAPFGDGT